MRMFQLKAYTVSHTITKWKTTVNKVFTAHLIDFLGITSKNVNT